MICVYPANCTDFSSNGLGAVSPMSCTVTETLNGEWELTLVHDIDERGKWTRLSEGCILRAPVPAAMTPSVDLVTQQYQTSTYDVQIYKITTRSGPLHLRSGTGTNYKILGKYKKGREVIVLNKTTSSWYEVTAPDGKHGYMASQYLTFQRTETQAVQTNVGFRNQVIEARQLRDQPFRIYRVVPELDKVTVYARNIFYDLLDNMIKSLNVASIFADEALVGAITAANIDVSSLFAAEAFIAQLNAVDISGKLTFCQANYQSLNTGVRGSTQVGATIGTLTGKFYSNTVTHTLNASSNAALFAAMKAYFETGNSVLVLYNGETSSSSGYSSNYARVTSCTISVTYIDAVIWYRDGGTWGQCTVWYRLNGAWVQVVPYYNSGGTWVRV